MAAVARGCGQRAAVCCAPAPWLVVHQPLSLSSRGVLASSAPDPPPGQPHSTLLAADGRPPTAMAVVTLTRGWFWDKINKIIYFSFWNWIAPSLCLIGEMGHPAVFDERCGSSFVIRWTLNETILTPLRLSAPSPRASPLWLSPPCSLGLSSSLSPCSSLVIRWTFVK